MYSRRHHIKHLCGLGVQRRAKEIIREDILLGVVPQRIDAVDLPVPGGSKDRVIGILHRKIAVGEGEFVHLAAVVARRVCGAIVVQIRQVEIRLRE